MRNKMQREWLFWSYGGLGWLPWNILFNAAHSSYLLPGRTCMLHRLSCSAFYKYCPGMSGQSWSGTVAFCVPWWASSFDAACLPWQLQRGIGQCQRWTRLRQSQLSRWSSNTWQHSLGQQGPSSTYTRASIQNCIAQGHLIALIG